jgi:AGZA family xanthine/uracil permease-like MFS transporter
MPFTYSVANGMGAGFVTHCIIKIATSKAREVNRLMWIVASTRSGTSSAAPSGAA